VSASWLGGPAANLKRGSHKSTNGVQRPIQATVRLMQPNLTPPLERSSICSAVIGGLASGPCATRHDAGKITCSGSVGVCLAWRKVLRSERDIENEKYYTIAKGHMRRHTVCSYGRNEQLHGNDCK
jgi:hypothetical protein